ncbi:MAG: hypothetical protein IKB09_00445 [Oscillospiraceae bacterium]|nr:hypothetical protein [Oscillospiraceae bacterium]
MKRTILYIGILALVLAAPVKPMEIEKLRPVQIVSVYKKNDWTVVETDTEDIGIGTSVEQAVQNMKDTSGGVIYLDTAEYLLLTKETEETAERLRAELKPSVGICLMTGVEDLQKAVLFLQSHGELPKLKEWKKGRELPILSSFGESFIFLKKVENKA